MKVAVVFLAAAVSLGTLWRETNSHAAAKRGRAAFEQRDFATAAGSYARARQLAPSRTAAFNLGTAQIAAGAREEGSATLAAALEDPRLTADAYYNRGNSALGAKALDHAVRDYVEALKADPSHAAAKRNLEIALARREARQRAEAAQQQQRRAQQERQEPRQPQGQQKPQPGRIDLDALLRSVQQQEQEELRRMKGRAGEARVGW
jgi:Ca-activated chloride channel homolog